MLAIDALKSDIEAAPFPHVVADAIFPPETYARLSQSYPVCPPASGPTGFTIHRGDAEFDAVMAANPDWRDLFDYCNSDAFVQSMAILFADEIDRSCHVERDAIHFADHIETRREKETVRIDNPQLPAEAMFVRFDFMQGMKSYARTAHLDHRRRLATLLIYFDTPSPETFSGGDLVLHERSSEPVERISPKANQAVFFPCSERSWHSVDAVTQCISPRRFLQISVSSCHDIWPDGRTILARSIARGKSAVRRLIAAAA